jgi:hypothetical protein
VNFKQSIVIALIAALPVSMYAEGSRRAAVSRSKALVTTKKQREAWEKQLAEITTNRSGFVVGERFTPLPLHSRLGGVLELQPGFPTLVLVVNTVTIDPNRRDYAAFRSLVDSAPNVYVVIATEEQQQTVAAAASALRHSRIRYIQAQRGFTERASSPGSATLYTLDRTGVIRTRTILDNSVRLPELRSALRVQM